MLESQRGTSQLSNALSHACIRPLDAEIAYVRHFFHFSGPQDSFWPHIYIYMNAIIWIPILAGRKSIKIYIWYICGTSTCRMAMIRCAMDSAMFQESNTLFWDQFGTFGESLWRFEVPKFTMLWSSLSKPERIFPHHRGIIFQKSTKTSFSLHIFS